MNSNFGHLLDPKKRVDFVSATNLSDNHGLENDQNFEWNPISGAEVREFYENLLRQPSSSKCDKVDQIHSIICEVGNGRLKSRAASKTRSQSKSPAFSQRDFRLFLKSATENDLGAVERYHSTGMSLEIQDMFQWTALMCAASAGAADVVDYLLRNGANAQQTDCSGRSAICLARKNNHFHVVQLFDNFRQFQDEVQLVSSMARKCNLTSGFCTICQVYYTEEEGPSRHESTIVHLINSGQLPSSGYSYEIPPDNMGYRLLKKSGWNETHGLGRDGEGRMGPIKTALKRDLKGLGMGKKLEKRVTHFKPFDKRAVEGGPSTSKGQMKRGQFVHGVEKKRQRDRQMEIEFRSLFND